MAYCRDGTLRQEVETEFALLSRAVAHLFSIVTEGEIRSLAERLQWGQTRQERLSLLLSAFERVPLESAGVIDAYVAIDNYSLSISRRMGKNDIWLVATAVAAGAALLTTDQDFAHLDSLFTRVIVLPSP